MNCKSQRKHLVKIFNYVFSVRFSEKHCFHFYFMSLTLQLYSVRIISLSIIQTINWQKKVLFHTHLHPGLTMNLFLQFNFVTNISSPFGQMVSWSITVASLLKENISAQKQGFDTFFVVVKTMVLTDLHTYKHTYRKIYITKTLIISVYLGFNHLSKIYILFTRYKNKV